MSNKNSNNVNITNVYGDNNEVGNKSTKSNEEESTAKFIWLLIAALLSAAAAITLGSIGDLGEEQAKKSMFEQHLKNKEYLHSEIESMTKRLSEEAKKLEDARKKDAERIAKAQADRAKAALKARQKEHKDALAADAEFYDAVTAAREQHRQNEADIFDLQSKSLVGGIDKEAQLNNELALLKITNDRELELMRQQYAHKTGLENEYQAAMKASKQQYYADVLAAHQNSVGAEIALYKNVASGISDQISALAGASDEEKRQLTKQFLLKQTLEISPIPMIRT